MSEFPATKTVHWPTEPIFACDKHANKAVAIGSVMGMQIPVTHAVPEGSECSNCKNEAMKGEK